METVTLVNFFVNPETGELEPAPWASFHPSNAPEGRGGVLAHTGPEGEWTICLDGRFEASAATTKK